ncbi:MAG: hypothetical protein HQL69_22885 [Magnetococcales bacterium]|nr:hypothetical protein [Magnetococcales bacterium]
MVNVTAETKKDISVVIDNSLIEHISKQLKDQDASDNPEEVVSRFLEVILNNSDYPIAAKMKGDKELELSFHMHSFSTPFFE